MKLILTRPFKVFICLGVFFAFIAGRQLQAQPNSTKVTGTVATEKGEPLQGASVKANNTKSGESYTIVTNEKGMFEFRSLSAGNTYNFTITHIGYAARFIKGFLVRGNENNSLLVKLSEGSADLEQFVIVGYGTQKKGDLTGAVAQVSGEVLNDRPMPNVARGLEGVVPGLNIAMTDGKPIRSPAYNIRGTTSIGSGGQALVLVDGIPGDPSLLNPNDIESVTVLKDAASAAIYGARAAYGVVLFTTKNPKKGKVQVNFNSNYSINNRTVKPQIVNDGYQWTTNFVDAYSAWYDYKSIPSTINGIVPYTPAYLDSLKARSLNPSLPKVTVDPATGKYLYYGSTDWNSLLYRDNTPAYENSLSVSGSNKNADFYISGRYYNQGGIFRYNPDNFTRYNLRMKGDINLAPWFTLSDNMDLNTYSYSYPLVNGMSPIWRYMDVSAIPMATLFNPDGTLTPSSYLGVGDLYTGNNKMFTKQLFVRNTVSFNADIVKNLLNLKGDFTYAYTNNNVSRSYYPVTYSAGPGIYGSNSNNLMNQSTGTNNYYATNLYAEAHKDFGDHSVKLLAGMNIEDNRFDSLFTQRDGIIDPSLPNFNLLNGQNYLVSGGGNEWAIAGFFFRANYAYKDKYLVEVNGRYDGSSKFPSYSQFGFFPSVSAGWVISKESFMSSTGSWLNNLKIRGSVGSLGNGNISPYRFVPSIGVYQSTAVALNGAYPTYFQTPNVLPSGLTWETSTTYDGGIDLSVFRNRLSVSFDYYRRNSTGMFTNGQPLPAVFGAAVPNGNFSDLKTLGWELSANWHDNINKNLSYSFGVVLSDSRAYITKFNNPNKILPYLNTASYYAGQRLGEIWGFETEGLFQSQADIANHADQSYFSISNSNIWLPGDIKFKDINHLGAVNPGQGTLANHGDLKVIGNSLPRYLFGVNMGMSWKSLSFSAFFQGIGHRDWWPGTEAGAFWGQYNRPYESVPAYMMKDVWSVSNPNAYYPRYRGYVALSGTRELAVVQTRYLQNAAYVRLKNVSVSWSLPQQWCSRVKLTGAKVYFTGQNLFTASPLHKYAANMDPEVIDNADPEVSAGAGNGYAYPMLKTYTVGLNMTF